MDRDLLKKVRELKKFNLKQKKYKFFNKNFLIVKKMI